MGTVMAAAQSYAPLFPRLRRATTLSTKADISSCNTLMGVMRRIQESPCRQSTGTPVRLVISLRTWWMTLHVCLHAWWPE